MLIDKIDRIFRKLKVIISHTDDRWYDIVMKVSRNISAMANAVQSANMVVLGFDPVIPLDETILSMYEVGQKLPEEFRCTCKGGLCTTKTAEGIVKKLGNSR